MNKRINNEDYFVSIDIDECKVYLTAEGGLVGIRIHGMVDYIYLNRHEGNLLVSALQAAIERARRRGKIGWVVGKTQQTVPGIRVGHECLVWTGEGRKIPKIVWRRETVVHRKQVLETPTGYLE